MICYETLQSTLRIYFIINYRETVKCMRNNSLSTYAIVPVIDFQTISKHATELNHSNARETIEIVRQREVSSEGS